MRAAQLTEIDPDWSCPWPLNWQRHYRHLTHLATDEPHGVLPDIAPGVTFDGDDIGRWLRQQRRSWAQLSEEQQQRLTRLGVQPATAPSPTPATGRATKRANKAQAAFQRGLAALTQWVEREGHRPVPRGHTEQITVDGQEKPVPVKLGVRITNTRTRRDKLTHEQLGALRKLGMRWA